LVANCCKIAKRFRGCIAHDSEDNALLELINTTAEQRRTSANNLVVRRSRVRSGAVKAVLALTTLLAASQIAGATTASGDAARHVGERLGSGDGERKTLLTQQIAFEPLPASVLFALGSCGGLLLCVISHAAFGERDVLFRQSRVRRCCCTAGHSDCKIE
jgi:hypothetical protein